jgi:beta-N-acetylhexosaminidase
MLLPVASQAAPFRQGGTPEERALELLGQLTPEERVGQLFLVTFEGIDASQESQIFELITNWHIGGVILQSENDNFVAGPDTVQTVLELNRNLQAAEWQDGQDVLYTLGGEAFSPAFIPLFIGISQEGDGYPYDQILNGLTPLPNAMTLGATWDPELAWQAGKILGYELSLLGFNLLLGPSLDVLENPDADNRGDIGVRSFGGDPYWVGQMGSAYVSGVHYGSENQLLVIAKHFPGHGGSDRPPDQEIPTINKSLEQLTRIELPPFYAVTGNAAIQQATADGLLLAHIRYQGFQGNIRATTRPVSFDPQAFSELMSLEPFVNWRATGGLIVSDQLDSRAVRRFYDPSEQTFNAPAVARDAFLAGNDLLYISDFVAPEDPDTFTTIIRTLTFFVQKYREDVAFAQRVDEAVLRILAKKFSIYGNFDLNSVSLDADTANQIVPDFQFAFEVGRRAATLISPSPLELDTVLPAAPGTFEQIVFITDSYAYKECAGCEEKEVIPSRALEQAVLRLYGPGAGGQIQATNLNTFSFQDLQTFLDGGEVEAGDLRNILHWSEWIVFVSLNLRDEDSSSFALRNLLSERPDLLRGKNVVVFAMNAPYYLDATDISKVSAYYALYSKREQMIELAARLLFKEITAVGASPVSISAVGYDLIEATAPDPDRTFQIFLNLEPGPESTPIPFALATPRITVTPTLVADAPTATPDSPMELVVGDLVYIRTGLILDQNGHRVPDNTPVNFMFLLTQEGGVSQREIVVNSTNGVAQTSFLLENPGTLQIFARSGVLEAESVTLQFDVVSSGLENVPTVTPLPTETPTLVPSPTATQQESIGPPPRDKTTAADWGILLVVTGFIGWLAYQTGATMGQVRWGVRWALTALIGGGLVNVYLSFDLPGSSALILSRGLWGAIFLTIGGASIGWIAGVVWKKIRKEK